MLSLKTSVKGFALAGLILLLTGCGEEQEPVHLGYVEADWMYVSAQSAGQIVDQPVDKGDRIEPGMLLFALEDTAESAAIVQADAQIEQARAQAENLETGARLPEIRALEARLDEARARLDQLEKDRQRTLNLKADGFATQAQVDAINAQYDMAEASVTALMEEIRSARLPVGRSGQQAAAIAAIDAAEAVKDAAEFRRSERAVYASVSGRIEEVFFKPGEYVGPGTPVLSVLPDNGLKVRFFVPEAELASLKVGAEVTISADGIVRPFKAKISFIAHEAEFTPPVIYSRTERTNLVFMVEADVSETNGLHPGLPVEVDWQ